MARAIVGDSEDEDLSSDASEVIPAARTKLEEKARPKQLRRTERQQRSTSNDSIAVVISGPSNPWEYAPFRGDTTVESVLEEWLGQDGKPWFKIEFEDGSQDEVSRDKLLKLRNGQNALDLFNNGDSGTSDEDEMSSAVGKRTRTKTTRNGYVDSSTIPSFLEEESDDGSTIKKRRLSNNNVLRLSNASTRRSSRFSSRGASRNNIQDDEEDDKEDADELAGDIPESGQDDSAEESEGSDITFEKPKRKRHLTSRGRGRPKRVVDYELSESEPERPTRRSGRERIVKSMKERDMDEEIYADEPLNVAGPKVISIREIYQPISKQSLFYQFHNITCDVCKGTGTNSNKGASQLIHCQGCSTSIHKICLGYRSGREHMVTKIRHENFVMQCRRCIGVAVKKDPLAARLDTCPVCKRPGSACKAFSPKRTAKQEEKLREENDGDDPITDVNEKLINNEENLLFRCTGCQRGYHFEHLPALKPSSPTPDDVKELRYERLKQYRRWKCKDCADVPSKVQTIVAWRPSSRDNYIEGETFEDIKEDDKEYLIKWEDKSYFKCSWMPGNWVWGATVGAMRKAFIRRDEGINSLPKWTSENAIPEEFLRMDIVFDVSYADDFQPKNEKADKAAIHMVEEVFVKFQGLPYEESVWEEPPEPEDKDRWSDFVAAYNEYVVGKYFSHQTTSTLKQRVENFQSLNFSKKVELKGKQPSALTGGQMMPYQMEGLNWLLYNFHQKKNVILADEMGLGKTIQIIAILAFLVKDNPKCWPFLVVTPNSTCPNWRREIKKWAPSLRVVAYYGGKHAKQMAMDYELYPEKCSDLRAHVVITSYEAPVEDRFFRQIKWAGMIVDEGQRLKNDESLLYSALKALKVPFQMLLTGTPLQNNKKELFNLLQFLDPKINAAKLDEEYEELTTENLPRLHELIRPFFLRRTKLQVLKFLPPMAQVILPVTMSVVQKRLYRSILSKNPELVKSIFGQTKTALSMKDRGNLNNILMQLRKCLCHPYLYSSAIEETKNLGEAELHRNLVDASSKFQLLEIMLPKLRERGHRVLLFSQFLNQLDLVEDFLSGMDLPFQRLDGTIGSLEKQKRIDAFNAPDSPLFAFLLSTRAGGVGINLATADTVIIMDPDFNPHQDIQALSRAHRIGQKNKVLVFQLMTKDSAEEKIVQIGRKKMALDQALIESMADEDDAGVDVESILKHGAAALFNDDDSNDIRYDSASVDKLLDRTQVENTNMDEEKTAESQFSFARVWANDKEDLSDSVGNADSEPVAPNFSVWDKILKQREIDAAEEAARNMQTFGRGKRTRQTVDYKKQIIDLDDDIPDSSPMKPKKRHGKDDESADDDFPGADGSNEDEDSEVELDSMDGLDGRRDTIQKAVTQNPDQQLIIRQRGDLPSATRQPPQSPNSLQYQQTIQHSSHAQAERGRHGFQGQPSQHSVQSTQQFRSKPPFETTNHHPHQAQTRQPLAVPATGPIPRPGLHGPAPNGSGRHSNERGTLQPVPSNWSNGEPSRQPNGAPDSKGHRRYSCRACNSEHVTGQCRLQAQGVELCGLCGIAHFGMRNVCPHLKSEVQIRLMLDALRHSKEPKARVDMAQKHLRMELAERSARKHK